MAAKEKDVHETSKTEANKLFQAGEYSAAIEIYCRVVQSNVTDQLRATVLSNRAACYLKLHENDKCLADCQQCIAVCDRHQQKLGDGQLTKVRSKAVFRRAEARVARGELREAVRDYEELLRGSKKKNKTVARRYNDILQQLRGQETAKDAGINLSARQEKVPDTSRQLSPGLRSFFGDERVPLAVVGAYAPTLAHTLTN